MAFITVRLIRGPIARTWQCKNVFDNGERVRRVQQLALDVQEDVCYRYIYTLRLLVCSSLPQASSSQSSGTSPASDDVGAGTTTLGGTAGGAVAAAPVAPRVPTPSSPLPDGVCTGPGCTLGCCATTDVQPRPRAACAGAGDDVCERPGPTAWRGIWATGARKSANFPNDVVEDAAGTGVAEAERRGDGMRESMRRRSCTLRWGSWSTICVSIL